jgi:hypothetical protein
MVYTDASTLPVCALIACRWRIGIDSLALLFCLCLLCDSHGGECSVEPGALPYCSCDLANDVDGNKYGTDLSSQCRARVCHFSDSFLLLFVQSESIASRWRTTTVITSTLKPFA